MKDYSQNNEQGATRIVIPRNDKPPYTAEQLSRARGYKGTQLEQADRAAGGPALRKKIRAEIYKCTERFYKTST